MAANSMAYALMGCSNKPGYLVCHLTVWCLTTHIWVVPHR